MQVTVMLGGPCGPHRSCFKPEWFSVIFSLWMLVVVARAPGIASGIVHLLHIRVLGEAVHCCPDLHYPLGNVLQHFPALYLSQKRILL